MQPPNSTAVLLDEHPLWLEALERILDAVEIGVVGKATDPVDALKLISQHRPTLFVLDIEMDGLPPDALACVRDAIARVPSLKVIVVSGADDGAKIDAAFAAGAAAYVLKRARSDDLASAFRQVFSRSLYLANGPAPHQPSPTRDAESAGLTRREREILKLVAEGGTNGDVARRLWVTEQTVKFHMANIFRKLDVTNRTQASRWAHAHGLLDADPSLEPATTAA